MYPTIHNFDAAVNPLHAPYTAPGSNSTPSSSSGRAPTSGQQSRPAAANGPSVPSASAFPTLQVTIDPRFQIAPPVHAPSQPPGAGGPAGGSGAAPPPPPLPVPGSMQPLDLDMERQLMHDLAPADGSGSSDDSGPTSSMQAAQEDPYHVLLARYTGMGYSRDEVAMALTVVGPDNSDDADKIVDACRKYKKLVSMGFKSDHVAGALIMHDGDLDEATNTCLDAAG